MGESREGQGGGGEAAASQVIQSILRAYNKEGREISRVQFQRVTTDGYTMIVWIHGESEPDGHYWFSEGEVSSLE